MFKKNRDKIISLLERWANKVEGYLPSYFVGVGNGVAAYTYDGITYGSGIGVPNLNWVSCASGKVNGISYVLAVASNANTANCLMRTTDGRNWTQLTLPSNSSWKSICFGNGVFAIVGTNAIMTSADAGQTWTSRTSPTNITWQGVCYGISNGVAMFVAGGGTANTCYSMDNGITWSNGNTVLHTNQTQFVFGNNLIFTYAPSASGGVSISSDNGITWTDNFASSYTNPVIIFGNSLFSIGVPSSPVWSIDGNTFSGISGLPGAWYYFGIGAYGNGLFIAIAYHGTGNYKSCISGDGKTYTQHTISMRLNWLCYKAK